MKYRLINRTRISRKVINKLIQFACPRGVNNFVISVMYGEGLFFGGEATNKMLRIYIPNRNIPNYKIYPFFNCNKDLKKAGYYPGVSIKNVHESILSLLAHELRHVWQRYVNHMDFQKGRVCKCDYEGKSWFTIYKFERDACKYAKKILLKYRKLQSKENRE